jgi:Tol biopolymer transport system component
MRRTDHMTLTAGARLGPYEILSLAGAGGMGEIYKARDTRLDRLVAIKLLPPDLAARADRRARFEAEARAISALSHPHICALFDVGEDEDRTFLVMEYLEGETLDDRLTRGPLPPGDVLRYAMEIADALDHAHRNRIVHRDLKPSNVMITASGAKLLDFGLARRPALAEPAGASLSTLSFEQQKITAEGTIVGTFQYMAPEQLEGKEADARTDIFAFGAVLYEMATGRRPFGGSSQASLIASILTEHPPAISSTVTRPGLPPALDHVVERCLAKNPNDRWQTARDLRLELTWVANGSPTAQAVASRMRFGRGWIAWAAAIAVVAAAVLGARSLRGLPPATDATRFVVAPPLGSAIGASENRMRLAISPDGRQLAFMAETDGVQQIWIRPLSSLQARPLAGTENGSMPFWSPDGKYVGFFSLKTGEMKKIDVSGGPSRTICTSTVEGMAEWRADGTILFTIFRDGIYRVSSDGGVPERVTALDKSKREINHYWPASLPDGKHFLYLATANDSPTSKAVPSVYVAALDGSRRTPLGRIHSRVLYAADGYLLFVEEGALLAQRFDVQRLQPAGEAVRVADGVAWFRSLGSGSFAVAANGTLAYLGGYDPSKLVWYDRHGKMTDPGWGTQMYNGVRISPDGQQAAVDVTDPRIGAADILIYDLARNVPSRFTSDPVSDTNAAWSPDGHRIVYTTERGGAPNVFTKSLDGSGAIDPMVINPGPIFSEDWSSDNRWVAYTVNNARNGRDIWLKAVGRPDPPKPFLNTDFEESGPRFSPDSAWLAFHSDESGTIPEVFVAPVGEPGLRKQVSIGGGTTPRWRRDGKELFYASADNRTIMAVPIESMSPFRAGIPSPLFTIGGERAPRGRSRTTAYDVTPDGARFLVSVTAGERETSRITVVLNWTAALKPD